MNNKEFLAELSGRLGYTNRDAARLVSSLLGLMVKDLQDGNTVTIQGFGTFDVKKKLERILINPATKQRMLVPPKLVLIYRPGTALKEKFR